MTPSDKKIRWGIIGAGRIAHAFAGDCNFAPSAELVAVASRSQENAEQFAQQYSLEKSYGDYQSLYSDPEVDAVYIATPHTHHLRQATDAMEAGKAVMCEKPLVISAEECQTLIETQKRTGIYLLEAMWTHFLPAIQKARQWVEEGRIGKVEHLKADFAYPLLPYRSDLREYNKELAGGALLEMGIYPVAIAWWFMRRDPVNMQVTAGYAPNGVEDDVIAVMDYGDAIASLGTSFRCRLHNFCHIIGDKGYIAIPDFFRASECHLYELDTLVDTFSEPRETHGFNYEIEAASQDILQGRTQSEIVPLSSSLSFQKHMDLIRSHF
jgi:predicted dehydrogenase